MTKPRPAPSYHLTRWWILRFLGGVYLVAFSIVVAQGPALIGESGLLPAGLWLDRLLAHFGSPSAAASDS